MGDLLKKEEIFRSAKEGNLGLVLRYLLLTKKEQFLTNEERDYLHWCAMINCFNNLLEKFEDNKIKDDYLVVKSTIEDLTNLYTKMQNFVNKDENGYFVVEEEVENAIDFYGDDDNLLEYGLVKRMISGRREILIDKILEFSKIKKEVYFKMGPFGKLVKSFSN